MGALRHGTCLAASRSFDDFCDGELSPYRERRLRRHLAGCRRCRRELARLQLTIGDLEALGRQPVPPVPSVLDRVEAEIIAIERGGGGPDPSGGAR